MRQHWRGEPHADDVPVHLGQWRGYGPPSLGQSHGGVLHRCRQVASLNDRCSCMIGSSQSCQERDGKLWKARAMVMSAHSVVFLLWPPPTLWPTCRTSCASQFTNVDGLNPWSLNAGPGTYLYAPGQPSCTGGNELYLALSISLGVGLAQHCLHNGRAGAGGACVCEGLVCVRGRGVCVRE